MAELFIRFNCCRLDCDAYLGKFGKKPQNVQSDNLNITDKLMELQQLKDKGILTSEEFEEKKKELISKY